MSEQHKSDCPLSGVEAEISSCACFTPQAVERVARALIVDEGRDPDALSRDEDRPLWYYRTRVAQVAIEALSTREGVEQHLCGHCGAQYLLMGAGYIEQISEALDAAGAPKKSPDGNIHYSIFARIAAISTAPPAVEAEVRDVADLNAMSFARLWINYCDVKSERDDLRDQLEAIRTGAAIEGDGK